MRRLRREMSDATEKERRDLFVAVVITCLAGLGNGYNIGALDVPALDVNDTIAGVISAAPFAGVTVSALAVVLVLKRGRVLTSIVGETMLVIGIVLGSSVSSRSSHWSAVLRWMRNRILLRCEALVVRKSHFNARTCLRCGR